MNYLLFFNDEVFKDNNKEGNSNKLDNIASNNVIDTNAPNATVPPKFETIKTEKPKNNTIEV